MPYDSQAIGNSLAGMFAIISIFSLAGVIFGIIVWWKIFSKAGYSGAMSLLLFIPIANLIVICILAFGNWPVLQELNQLRQRVGMPNGPQGFQNPQYPPSPQNLQYPQYPQDPQNQQYQQYR